jgi:hypothetical protein
VRDQFDQVLVDLLVMMLKAEGETQCSFSDRPV